MFFCGVLEDRVRHFMRGLSLGSEEMVWIGKKVV